MATPKTGIDQLRSAVKLFDQCRESFNASYQNPFTLDQLVKIYKVHCAQCDLTINPGAIDIYPDDWSAKQVQNALDYGAIPEWEIFPSGELKPVYNPATWKVVR
jgi:hypothetical protein